MSNIVIVSAVRTALGGFMGSLSKIKATELGTIVVKAALEQAGLAKDQVDEVIMGNVLSTGLGQNPARQALIGADIPVSVPAFTVNKVCGSGMKSVMLAAQAIKAGDCDAVIAGGMENMSQVPFFMQGLRTGMRLGHGQLTDGLIHDGLWDVYNDFHMGSTAELVAAEYSVSREAQDEFAADSQAKAVAAIESGAFKNEIVPVSLKQRKGDPIIFETDEGPRAGTTAEKLGKLRAVFQKDGTVTAGNASTINDGAAALCIMSEDKANALGLKPLARITGYATGGLEPKWVMMTPQVALKNLKTNCGIDVNTVDLIELNEAFSVQGVALIKEMKLDASKVNVNGGAVALGHPIGCSGARILVTLIHALQTRGLKTGVASLCLGGGNAVATSIELI